MVNTMSKTLFYNAKVYVERDTFAEAVYQEDGWIKALLSEEQSDMKRFARTVLHAAEKLYGSSDDMTVLTVRVERRQ